jgi:nitrite reductase/ring-hydroxylating ferredoxin subunit
MKSTEGGYAVVNVGRLDDLDDPGSREFRVGEGDWPFRGFVVRKGNQVFAYQNYCMHVGHPLNWQPDRFLTEDGGQIVCSSHGALYEIDTGICVAGPCTGAELISLPVDVRAGMIVVQVPR